MNQLMGLMEGGAWERWLQTLPSLESISIPRSFKKEGKVAMEIELHTFCDASQQGYSACAYFRVKYNDGSVACVFALGKSRVAPLRPITVPRLELMAAVIAAKLAAVICKEVKYFINRIVFWCDAIAVLGYINNKSCRYKTFVANRLELIHSLTASSQWRYVPTSLNPADVGSRGLFPDQIERAFVWFNGPSFLCKSEREWPEQSVLPKEDKDDPELKKISILANVMNNASQPLEQLYKRHSEFYSLQRTVAWLNRFMEFIKWKSFPELPKPSTEKLSLDELEQGTMRIIRVVQKGSFGECLKVLPDQHEFVTPSPITSELLQRNPCLWPIENLDPRKVNGIIRVGGRLKYSPLPDSAKFPILLPSDHHVTQLIIMEFHIREGHMGINHVLNATRSKYWILKGHSTVKKALRSCLNCRF